MSDAKDFMVTTYDNPFNPFTQFDRWFKEDMMLGHDTCGTLARLANTSEIFSDEVNETETLRAIDEMISMEPTLYRKVLPTDYDSFES